MRNLSEFFKKYIYVRHSLDHWMVHCDGDMCGYGHNRRKRKRKCENEQKMTITTGEWTRMLENPTSTLSLHGRAKMCSATNAFPVPVRNHSRGWLARHSDADEQHRPEAEEHEVRSPFADHLSVAFWPPRTAAAVPASPVEVLPGPRRTAARRRSPPRRRSPSPG